LQVQSQLGHCMADTVTLLHHQGVLNVISYLELFCLRVRIIIMSSIGSMNADSSWSPCTIQVLYLYSHAHKLELQARRILKGLDVTVRRKYY
jgi:hypothetical protein